MRSCPPRPWAVLSFAPFFFTAAFLGRFVVGLSPGEDIPIRQTMGSWGYPAWFALGIVCPIMLFVSWRRVLRGGRFLYSGLWLRLGADLGMAFALAAFIIAYWSEHVAEQPVLDDSHRLGLALFGSIWAFLAVSVVFDVWRIVAQNEIARQIRQASE